VQKAVKAHHSTLFEYESVGHVEKKIRRANEVDFADIGFRGKDLVNAEIRWVPLSSTSPFSFAFQISLNSP